MKAAEPAPGPPLRFPPEGGPSIDFDFLHRVYRTSIVLMLVGSLYLWAYGTLPALVGWVSGAAVNLLSTIILEWTVRRLAVPGARSPGRIVAVGVAKMAAIALLLAAAWVAAVQAKLSPFWMLAGYALPHAVILLKLLGWKVLEWTSANRPR